MFNRRYFLVTLGAGSLINTFPTAFPSLAQQAGKIRVIGYLSPSAQPTLRDEVFTKGLRELGWIEGQNLRIEFRRGANNTTRLVELATELENLKVDVLVVSYTPAVADVIKAKISVPVISISGDPVGNGFVKSLGRPGGNITGISLMAPDLAGKRLELLREISPRISRVAFLGYAPDPSHKIFLRELEDAARSVKPPVQVHAAIVSSTEELPQAFEGIRKARAEALIVQPLFVNALGHGPRVLELAAKLRLATVSDGDNFAEIGGLAFYGADPLAIYQRLAYYADRVLKGTNPAELPIEQPRKFLLVVNMKIAKQLGLKVPQTVLLRAEKVID